jgi:Zn-dependent protease with chaperone function
MTTSSYPALAVRWFDGHGAVPCPAILRLNGKTVVVESTKMARDYAERTLAWPEPWLHAPRQIRLPDGGVLVATSTAEFDAWFARNRRRHPLIVRWQRSVWMTLLTLALLLSSLFAAWRWGVPLAADATVSMMPADIDQRVGQNVLAGLDRRLLRRSQLTGAERRFVFDCFADAIDTGLRNHTLPKLTRFKLEFRDGGADLGPNALALPDGSIVVTDELVHLLKDDPTALVGVLGHELGHVKHRHGMRLLLRSSVAGLATGVLIGDFSTLLALAPALLAEQSYSRDFEREADQYALTILRGARLDPSPMARFFERVAEQRKESAGSPVAIAFSSHPADAERIAFFRGGTTSAAQK